MATDQNRDDEKFDGTEGEREPGVDVAKPLTDEPLEHRSDDHAMSLKIAKELPRHEAAVRGAGLDVTDQHDTFEYQAVTLPAGEDERADPGPDSAAVTAAINAGYRPTGESVLTGPEDHPDGVSKVWTWKIPVLKVKAPTDDREGNKYPDNTTVRERHDDAAKTPAENKAEADKDAKSGAQPGSKTASKDKK